jgi:hypothetical protein
MRRLLSILVTSLALGACVLAQPPPTLPSITNGYGWMYGSHVHWQGDKDFTEDERRSIALACLQWTAWTNGGMRCTVDFLRDFEAEPFQERPDEFAIIKVTSDDLPPTLRGRILGYAASYWNPITGCRNSALFMITDNLDSIEPGSHRQWLHVAKHEMGHAYGFEHLDEHHYRPNVMHAGYSHDEDDQKFFKGSYFGEDDKAQCIRLGLCKF